MRELLERRIKQRSKSGNVVREFEVPKDVFDRLTKNAVPEAPGVRRRPGRPTINDNLPDQFGFHPDDAEELFKHAIPGSGKTLGLGDF